MSEILGTRERVSNFFAIANGKVVKSLGKVKPLNMSGVTERINKDGVTVFEILGDFIRGHVKAIELKDPPADKQDFGRQIVFTMKSISGEVVKINLKFDSAYGRGFMYSAPLINWSDPIELEPYKYFSNKKQKDVIGLSVLQYGSRLDWAYGTRDNMGGMPQLEEIEFKGKKVWDNTKQLMFLTEKFSEILDKVVSANSSHIETSQEEHDDLPF